MGDLYLAAVGGAEDEWHRELAVEIADRLRRREAVVGCEDALRHATQPMVKLMIVLASGSWPGLEVAEDVEWAASTAFARREVSIWRGAGIDGGLADLNDAILDWVDAQIEHRSQEQGFAAMVRTEIDELLQAGQRGRERGRQLRRRAHSPGPPADTSAGWLLRHPRDHYFRSALGTIAPGPLAALIDAEVRVLDQSYERLAAAYTARHDVALVAELEVLGPVGHGWKEPISTVILSTDARAVSVGDRLALRLVADPTARRFDGTLISVREGERWLIHAERVNDDTIIPQDGSLRLAA